MTLTLRNLLVLFFVMPIKVPVIYGCWAVSWVGRQADLVADWLMYYTPALTCCKRSAQKVSEKIDHLHK
jgi:hypothetical protein